MALLKYSAQEQEKMRFCKGQSISSDGSSSALYKHKGVLPSMNKCHAPFLYLDGHKRCKKALTKTHLFGPHSCINPSESLKSVELRIYINQFI